MNQTIKSIVTLLAMMAIVQGSYAQESPERSLSLELQGVHNLVGINYDSRFKGNDGFGYRIGIGYAYGYSDFSFMVDFADRVHGVAVPLEVNFLLGKHNSKLELGAGTSLGYYWESIEIKYTDDDSGVAVNRRYRTTENRFGYFMFGNIGYRLQTKRGFQFRVGWVPSINFNDRHCIHRYLGASYISFGWRL